MGGWDVKSIPQVTNWNGTPSKGVFVLTRGKAAPAHIEGYGRIESCENRKN